MGYTELDRPPLSARALTRALVVPGGLWSKFDVRDETGSTNADAAAAAAAGAPEGLVVVAESQLAGRGRRDRQWTSPPRAGLTVSVLLRPGSTGRTERSEGREGMPEPHGPGVPPSAYGWLPLLAGVALVEAVARIGEVESALKWPNDLLIDERKCAGILAEVAGDAVVIGIGVNVSTRADELPETTGVPATSLLVAGAASTDRSPLLRALLRSMARWYEGWREAGGDAEMCGLLAAYQRHCATIGRRVRVLLPGGAERTGEAVTVDSDGQLVIRTEEGVEFRVSAGDVLHVR
ncbi:biotin--[acetyl-CoA-carboxylase] ligase [Actinoplanes italicus]|uniref:biotin--[biotin carboxyl-carrier protein] ligase n=1 Tax=Actinoplanes italicus TaxID=113567 RepID=A0A2T0KLL3_9ACTN|nr:biotin--[acetyl-CoA-carboxylase] ligase [Actinoplanes italicus]PRX24521.1 BirA family biotin operon repressor/biotin-[acetyl-CoA-carboxylase] ligase [Actinoplanes italicus]GIE27752.1 biotin--[acetyl-CoA-carboxylase] ligase [Actinoplanes italicus]